MTSRLTRQSARYGFAVLASGTALLVQLLVTGYIGPGLPPYLFLYPAVMLTATVCGLGPGLLATAVSTLLAASFILPPGGPAAGSPVDLLGLVIFAWMGAGISLLAGWYHRAQDRAARTATALAAPEAEDSASSHGPQDLREVPGAAPRRVPLRRWLALLALSTALPLLLFAVVVLVWLVGGYQADQDRRHTETTRALALAVDAEIRSWKTALQALAGSQNLQDGHLAGFYQEAVAVAARHGGWIALYDASGQQRLNTLRSFGSSLPKTANLAMIQALFRERQPIVTDLSFGAAAQRDIVAVGVPVVREGHVLYALNMGFTTERLVRLLADQRFPATWITALNDGRQRVVARVPDSPERRGQPAVSPQARAFAAQTSGALDATLSDGRTGRIAFQRLREAPWTVSVVVPVTELRAAWQRPVLAFLLLGGLAVFGAIGLAVGLARKIARPVMEAATLAATVVQGQTPALSPSGIAEVAVLQDALADGAAGVRTATQARDEALTALREANASLEARVTERTRALAEANTDLHLEIAQRQQAEAALKHLAAELEQKVRERTAELSQTVESLQGEAVEHLQAEASLQRTNQLLRMLSASNEALVRIDDEQSLMQEICRIAVEIGGYRMAWVGFAEADAEQRVRPVASTGFEAGYLETARISWADTERGRGPTGTAIRLGEAQLGVDFLTEPRLAPWRADAITRGYRSSIALPLRQGETVVGALTIYAAEPAAFGDAQVPVLLELAKDLAFGLHAGRVRAALRDSHDRLRALAGELTLAEHRERRRIAQVLHDHLQQVLVAAKLRLMLLGRGGDAESSQAAREIEALVAESLTVSRTLTAELSPPILNEAGWTPSLAWLARWMAEKHGLTVELAVDHDLPQGSGDVRVLLYEAVRELLFNVVKHARVKAAAVTVRRGPGDRMQIVVADTGAGFDPAAARPAGAGEEGFGLFSIRERLELVGGRLEVESAPGRGSRFTLTVPLGTPPGAGSPAAALAPASERVPVPQGSAPTRRPRIRLLVADDHPAVRREMARMVGSESDIEIAGEASTGEQAIELTRQLVPDVVLLDVSMPGIGGVEATRRIHAEWPGVRVIGLSMHDEAEQGKAMLEAGAADYLTKTCPADVLLAAIRGSLDRQ